MRTCFGVAVRHDGVHLTARKVVIHRPGGYERLVLESLNVPVPGAGEVLVATEAIGVNYADCVIRHAHLGATGKLVIYGFHSMLPRKGGPALPGPTGCQC